MPKDPILYVCKNAACPLGTRGQLGKFTSGLHAETRHLRTGEPLESLKEGEHYGEGFCPECMQFGEKYDPEKAKQAALADAEAQHAAHIKAIKEGVA
jgi:hypothetical protein